MLEYLEMFSLDWTPHSRKVNPCGVIKNSVVYKTALLQQLKI